MNIFTLGGGFISEHLPYPRILDKFEPSPEVINELLNEYEPDVLINCIGKTGRPNIDWCENHKGITAETNTVMPIALASACEGAGIHMIQISSGCIYFGDSPRSTLVKNGLGTSTMDSGWKESDFANPQSFYSRSKYACDLILGDMPHVTSLRIRMPISDKNNPRNLINKLRGYKQIIDIPNSVTFLDDFVRCVDWAAHRRPAGIFHITNPEPLSAKQVMQEYQKYDPNHTFDIITGDELDQITLAKRSNCILDTSKLNNAGFHMTPTMEALAKCMASYAKNV
jgi:3,5-epimerase/4-reductase